MTKAEMAEFDAYYKNSGLLKVQQPDRELTWAWRAYFAAEKRHYQGVCMRAFGIVELPKPLLRFDHPGRNLAEKYFSARLLGERRK